MFTVLLVVLAVAGVWASAALAVAFLAGGVIHARDHRDTPYGGFGRPHAINPMAVAQFTPTRVRR